MAAPWETASAPSAAPWETDDAVKSLHEQRLATAENALADEQKKALPMSLGSKIATGADLGAAGLSKLLVGGVGGSAAGLGARLTGNDPEAAKEWVDKNMVYHPHTDAGQAIGEDTARNLADMAHPLTKALQAADTGIGDTFGQGTQKVVRQAAGTVGDIAGSLPAIGAVSKTVQTLLRAGDSAVEVAKATEPLRVAEAAGIKVRPSDVVDATGAGPGETSLTARAGEALGGSKDTRRAFIRSNKPKFNNIAAQDIGLSNDVTKLTDDAIASAKKPLAATYKEVREALPEVSVDPQFIADMTGAGRGTQSKVPLPESVNTLREHLIQQGNLSSGEIIDTMSDLRRLGTKALMSEDPNTVALGNAQMGMAKALESRLDRALASSPDMSVRQILPKYRDAREGFAKIHAVEEARVGFDVDPQALRRFGERTGSNTGGLKVIQDVATHFPKIAEVQVPEPSHLPLSTQLAYGAAQLTGIPWAARKLLSATRGVSKTPQLGLNKALSYYYKDNTPISGQRPDLRLTAPPGNVYEPHQPQLLRADDSGVTRAESSQVPQDNLHLASPPGQAFDANQHELPFGEPLPPETPAARGPTGEQTDMGLRQPTPAEFLGPLDSTVSRSVDKAQLDHLMQVLSRLRNNQ